ncbi:DUF1836 domain-containing protein [Paratractidigestivibacter sp.]|uniref:DUF1836 domain-containing protein n=1 Tax=Paratractidigestivibacter sp. TaxID=2847316 RepID=UPI002AC986BE|nr:DUF1836 domain-containing protein [Paratractidigestivibacter sp.]
MGTKQAKKYEDGSRALAVASGIVTADAADAFAREALVERMACAHIYRIDELPRIELYLDQVLTLVSDELVFMCLPGEQILTGPMVNNYVKQKLLPAPLRKRYTAGHVAALLFICAFKRVYSIAQLSKIMGMIDETHVDAGALYDEVVSALERAIAEQFVVGADFVAPVMEPHIRPVDKDGNEVAPGLARVLEAAVTSLAAKVYVEQTLALAD